MRRILQDVYVQLSKHGLIQTCHGWQLCQKASKLAKTVASDGTPSKQPSSFRHVTSLDGRTYGWVSVMLLEHSFGASFFTHGNFRLVVNLYIGFLLFQGNLSLVNSCSSPRLMEWSLPMWQKFFHSRKIPKIFWCAHEPLRSLGLHLMCMCIWNHIVTLAWLGSGCWTMGFVWTIGFVQGFRVKWGNKIHWTEVFHPLNWGVSSTELRYLCRLLDGALSGKVSWFDVEGRGVCGHWWRTVDLMDLWLFHAGGWYYSRYNPSNTLGGGFIFFFPPLPGEMI